MKLSPADDARGDFHERLVYGGEAFESDAQASEVVKPCEGTLDDPSGLAETTAVGLTPTGDLRGDADSVSWLAIFVAILSAIGLHDDRLGHGASPLAANGRDGFDQRQQPGDVVAVGGREDQHKRDAPRFGHASVTIRST
ncbi:conserved protein of unknown function [Burkholderia multivorans]